MNEYNTYRVELEDDNFEIIFAASDEEAVREALDTYEMVFNVILLDNWNNEVRTVF